MAEAKGESGLHLVSELTNRLEADERLEISHLGVLVQDGVAVLAGEVPNLFQKELAGQVASQVDGIRKIENRLTVAEQPPEGAATSLRRDDQMAREVLAALAASSLVNQKLIYVRVQDGVIYLEGSLTSEAEKQEAEAIARLTPGAQDVVNRIKVVPVQPRPDDEVEGNVRAALLQELLLGPSEIEVKVRGGVVYLEGSVWNRSMRDRVEAVASRAPGVQRVVNELSVKERR